MCNIFNNDDYKLLKEIVNDWHLSTFKKKEKIWNQCLDAHIEKKYLLSIPYISNSN